MAHLQAKFSYTRDFIVEQEETGILIIYKSGRSNFLDYPKHYSKTLLLADHRYTANWRGDTTASVETFHKGVSIKRDDFN